jgi:putative oxidoreductase
MKKKQEVAALLLRLTMGFGFMAHGWAKISRGTQGFEKLLAFEGVPLAHLNGMIAPYVELLGGLALIAGAYVVIVAVPLIVTMLVATFFVQGHYGFSAVKTIGLTPEGPLFGPPGFEINLLYISGLVSLICTGPGAWSIDSFREAKVGPKGRSRLRRLLR